MLVCNLLMLAAALAFRGPLSVRLALGALLVCNPIAVARRGSARTTRPACCCWCWPSRWSAARRFGWAAASLAGAVLLKQFALVAAPFLALMIWKLADRDELQRAALAFGGVLAAGILPFLIADPVAFYDDTIKYGAGTYRIVGYGLSAILVRTHVLADRDGSLPVRADRAADLGAADRLAADGSAPRARRSGSGRRASRSRSCG